MIELLTILSDFLVDRIQKSTFFGFFPAGFSIDPPPAMVSCGWRHADGVMHLSSVPGMNDEMIDNWHADFGVQKMIGGGKLERTLTSKMNKK